MLDAGGCGRLRWVRSDERESRVVTLVNLPVAEGFVQRVVAAGDGEEAAGGSEKEKEEE
jgi:hypothetical protein